MPRYPGRPVLKVCDAPPRKFAPYVQSDGDVVTVSATALAGRRTNREEYTKFRKVGTYK